MTFCIRFTLIIVLALACFTHTSAARSYSHLFAGGLSYAWPSGGLAENTAANSSLGLALGYLYKASSNIHVGVQGTWTRMTLGKTDTIDYSSYGLTHVGLYADVLYRPFKHGWSPYAQIEAGMGFVFADQVVANQPIQIDGLSEVTFSTAAKVGVLIPMSEQVDLDIAGRWFSTYVNDGLSMLGAQLGIVYAMR